MKEYSFTIGLGLLLCISGEVIRKLAMFTARTNFNHIVQVCAVASQRSSECVGFALLTLIGVLV